MYLQPHITLKVSRGTLYSQDNVLYIKTLQYNTYTSRKEPLSSKLTQCPVLALVLEEKKCDCLCEILKGVAYIETTDKRIRYGTIIQHALLTCGSIFESSFAHLYSCGVERHITVLWRRHQHHVLEELEP